MSGRTAGKRPPDAAPGPALANSQRPFSALPDSGRFVE
ncbi:hypothetical protein SAMN04489835_3034 [Mycolicibacterium rutilum]|uniref:Uncharacterized protein n=1 Tax=Mycolicibacterium rutilum TaxID=370526 RepID=A0A1H6K4B5_MYCRU|nr:hypothetical protein SAMN04489835_3034 [Mycolicibacterium rutilum]